MIDKVMASGSTLASIVKICHWALILFILLAPILGNEIMLTYHAIMVPGILIHWVTNNNVCSLTMLESQLTNIPTDKTFIGQILHPFFEVNNMLIYALVIGLWLLTMYKLQRYDYSILRKTFRISYALFWKVLSWLWGIISWPYNMLLG